MKAQVNFVDFCTAIQELDLDGETVKATAHTSAVSTNDWNKVNTKLGRQQIKPEKHQN